MNTRVWPTGHFWAGEGEIDGALRKQARGASHFLGLRGNIVWPVVGEQMRVLRYGWGTTRPIVLYHGCPVNALASVMYGDMGKGVYFTGAKQAGAVAADTSTVPDSFIVGEQRHLIGFPTVNMFRVALGECKVITRFDATRCTCDCGAQYTDHEQSWHTLQGFNSVMRLAGAGTPHFQVCLPMPTMEFLQVVTAHEASVEGEIQ